MKVLQICNKVPFPPKDGGCIAMNNLTDGLFKQGFEMKVLAINTHKHFVNIKELPLEYLSKTSIEAVYIDTKVRPLGALWHLIKNDSYNLSRFYSEEFEEKIVETLKSDEYDIIQLESLYVSIYIDVIRKHTKAKIVLRAHNIESMIWERKIFQEKNPFKRIYISILQKQLLEREIEAIDKVDSVLPITKNDADWIIKNTKQRNIKTIPFGVDVAAYTPTMNVEEKRSLFFIGAFDWFPNVDGLIWFIQSVWPKILQTYPDANFYVAGRGMDPDFKNIKTKNLHILGEVDDVKEFVASKQIMVVPLFTAGGMRVKIIEGMAMGKVIISTSIGAEGINAEHKKELMIADSEEEFLVALRTCFSDDQLMQNMTVNARKLVETNYDNGQIAAGLALFYKQI